MSWKRGSSGGMSEEEEENCDVLLVDESEFLDEEALLQPDADGEDPDPCTNDDDLLEGDGDDQVQCSPLHEEAADEGASVENGHSDVTMQIATQDRPVSRELNESGKAEPNNSSGAAKEDVSEVSQPSATQAAQEPKQSKSSDTQLACLPEESSADKTASTMKKAGASECRPSSDHGQQQRESNEDRRGGSARLQATRTTTGNDSQQPPTGKPTTHSVNARSFHGSLPDRPGVLRSQQGSGYSSHRQYPRGRGGGALLRSPMRPASLRTSALTLSALTHPTPNSQQNDLQHLLNVLTAAAAASSAPVQGMAVPQVASGPASPPFVSSPLASTQVAHIHRGLRGPIASLEQQQQRFPTPRPVQQEQWQRTSSRPYDIKGHMMHRAFTADGDGPADLYERQGPSGQHNSRETSPAVTGRRGDTGGVGGHSAVARDDGEEKVRIDYNHGTGDCDYRIPRLQQQQQARDATADSTNRSSSPNLHMRESEPGARKQTRDFPAAAAGEQNPEVRASPGRSRLECSRQNASDGCSAAAEGDSYNRHQPEYLPKGLADQFVVVEAQSLSGSKSDARIAGIDDDYLKRLRQQELRREEIVRHKEAQRQREAERKRLELERTKLASTNRSTSAVGDERKPGLGGSVDRQPGLIQNPARQRPQPQATPAQPPLHKMPAAGEKGVPIDRATRPSVAQHGEPMTKRRLLDTSSQGVANAGAKWLATDASGKSPAEKQRLLRQRLLQLQQQSGLKRKLGATTEGSHSQPGSQLLPTPLGASNKRDVSGSSSTEPVLPKPLPVQHGQQPASADKVGPAARLVYKSPQMSAWPTQHQQLRQHQQHRQESVEQMPTEEAANWSWPSKPDVDNRVNNTHSDRRLQSQQTPAPVLARPYHHEVQQRDNTYIHSAPISSGSTSVRVKNISASTPLVTLCMLAATCGRVNNAFFTNDVSGQAVFEFATEAAAEMFCRKYNNYVIDRARITAALIR